jgi:predicted AAA+ superfamily ATPase
MGPLDAPEEVDGIALETLFLQELIALNSAFDFGYKIFYWRTSNGREVDFILYGPKGLLAFEIKRTSRMTSPMFGGLKSFLADYPVAKAYFVYAGNRRMYDGKIEIVPVLEMLKNLKTMLGS